MRRFRACVVGAAASFASACSTSPYVAPISAFGTGTESFVAAHDLMLAGERDDTARVLTALTYTSAPKLAMSAGCVEPGNCVLEVDRGYRLRPVGGRLPLPPRATVSAALKSAPLPKGPASGPAPADVKPGEDACAVKPDETTASAPAIAAANDPITEADILAALQGYAKALKAVSNAEDTAAFNAASTSLSTSLGKLGLAAGPFGAAVGPAAKLVTAGIGLVLEARRYEALRTGLLTACPAVRVLSRAIGQFMADSRERRIGANGEVLSIGTQNSLADTSARSEVLRLALAAQVSQNSLALDPAAVAAKFAKSHDELVVAVRDGKGQGSVILADVQTLAEAATALKTSLSGAPQGSSTGAAKP